MIIYKAIDAIDRFREWIWEASSNAPGRFSRQRMCWIEQASAVMPYFVDVCSWPGDCTEGAEAELVDELKRWLKDSEIVSLDRFGLVFFRTDADALAFSDRFAAAPGIKHDLFWAGEGDPPTHAETDEPQEPTETIIVTQRQHAHLLAAIRQMASHGYFAEGVVDIATDCGRWPEMSTDELWDLGDMLLD